MASAIDATKPTAGSATTQSMRDNFAAAKSEIEALQAGTGLNDGAVVDAAIGTRTPDQTVAAVTGAGTLTQVFNWFANRIKAISGETNWYDAVGTSLKSHVANNSNPHGVTAAQAGAAALAGSASQTFSVGTATAAAHAIRYDQLLYPYRNVAINGDMSVSQVNGTTLVTTGIATNTYVIDQMIVNAATAAVTAGQSTDATGLPTGFRTNLKISGAASNTGVKIKHRIEAKNVAHFAGRKIAISFYAYQDSGATFASATVKAFCPTTTADTFSALTQEGATQTISIANAGTISKYTVFITIGASNVSKGLEIEIDTVGALLAGKTMYVTGLQIEAVVADAVVGTDFEFLPYAEQLRRAQRYLPVFKSASTTHILSSAYAFSTTGAEFVVPFEVETRVAPTGIVVSNVAHISFIMAGPFVASAVGYTTYTTSLAGAVDITIAGATAGQGGVVAFNNASGLLYFTGAQL